MSYCPLLMKNINFYDVWSMIRLCRCQLVPFAGLSPYILLSKAILYKCCITTLQEFREERDKLVSGLEAILKNKDAEIKQHKALIKQLKEREADLTKVCILCIFSH